MIRPFGLRRLIRRTAFAALGLALMRCADAAESFPALRAAINDLSATFPKKYPDGGKFLARLDELAKKQDKAGVKVLRREALIANPLVSGRPILFVARRQYRGDHHNTATMFVTGEINARSFKGGSALKTIGVKTGGVKTLVKSGHGGVRDPDVHFGGAKIVFSMRKNAADDYHIYEIGATGSGLRQLTSAKGVADIDPLYLADDSIAFTSTREPKYCMCNRHIMGNLFKMGADGANIHQISRNTLHDGHGSLMPDGRILYDRWEYVDRNFGDAQGLWTVNPDGTNHAVYWGNNTNSPGGVLDARVIPGTQRALCIFGSCHDRPWGALAIIDRRLGVDGRGPVVRTWPAHAINQTGRGNWDAFARYRPKYEDPYPLSAKYFLVSRTTGRGEQMGIYLLDVFGNEILLHTEGAGCFDPMPLGPRPRPDVIPTRRNFENNTGRFYVQDVYRGTHMQRVRRGSVKFLRVVESPAKKFWTHAAWGGQGVHCPGMNWHSFENKRILATVPVETDGSAYFEVPSDRFVYFQALDKDGLMIQSMRSGTMVQSGETTGCVGCHEDRRTAPPVPRQMKMPLATRRPPSKAKGWYGKPRLFNYIAEVQPVFDKHCVRCHDFGKAAGRKLNLAGDRNLFFNASYTELWRKRYIRVVGAGPSQIQPAYSWGSHASPLVRVIRQGHKGVKLSAEDFDRIVTWIDLNAVYYPHYGSAYPNNPAGRSPLDGRQVGRLSRLTAARFHANHGGNRGPLVSFDRPEISPCLARLKDKSDPRYKEALAIIRAGAEMLKKRPRADMPGFKMCPADERRQKKYTGRQKAEERFRAAVRGGEKVYDPR